MKCEIGWTANTMSLPIDYYIDEDSGTIIAKIDKEFAMMLIESQVVGRYHSQERKHCCYSNAYGILNIIVNKILRETAYTHKFPIPCKGIARLHPADTFDVEVGKRVAYLKLRHYLVTYAKNMCKFLFKTFNNCSNNMLMAIEKCDAINHNITSTISHI